MAAAVSNGLDSLADQLPNLPEVFPSLSLLAEAEEEDSKRIRPSRVGWWRDVCRVRGSALGRIWQSIVGFTIWASLVAVLDLVFERKIALTHNVTPLLSVVVGLLLVFRNGSAYSRWDDGRKQWAKMVRSPAYVLTAAPSILHSRTSGRTGIIQLDTHMEQMSISRSLTRTIWIHVAAGSPSHGLNGGHRLPAENGPNLFVKAQNDQHDKVSAARLVVAFLVATKHHIRREYGVNWPDLGHILTPNLERLAAATGSGWGAAGAELIRPAAANDPATAASNGDIRLTRQRSRSSMLSEAERGRSRVAPQERYAATRPPLASPYSFRSFDAVKGGEREPLLSPSSAPHLRKKMSRFSAQSSAILADYAAKPSLPLPLIIAHHLTLYFAACKRDGLIESIGPPGFNALNQAVVQLVECFTTCERMANIDIPTIYGIHLKQCTSFFLATLPFVLLESMGFGMIPFVTLVAFTLCGIEGIATELEMPFGFDDSDLNLDLFCAEIRNEVEHMIMCLPASLDEREI
ncbi:hypothetical protein C6P46_006888 [Rhodotorula mucilaginosa]|uniref:Uncharacterized protein n=1 Tax=Rhodotorula mucilaginosa TaxID=5537 RepID=A0A9P6W808_RHOMI|nr:hypothetical protein C6P46_006888 [Rhodotorula mucilaginosa]